MGKRLFGFDYKRPYFYMVTLQRAPGWQALSTLIHDPTTHFLKPDPLTQRLSTIIRSFHEQWTCLYPIDCFSIMPDHIHLLIRLRPPQATHSLPRIVWLLQVALERGYLDCCPKPPEKVLEVAPHLFQADWHDWIVTGSGQVEAFTRYIRENPARRLQRIAHAQHFQRLQGIDLLGHHWFAYGNLSLLDSPVIDSFQCSRRWQQGDEQWNEALCRAERLGPGCAGISTFMSPCEKACGNAIFKAKGSLIVLHPEGFGERWHPSRSKATLCAQGRLLFLSLYPASTHKLTAAELYTRCHTMGDLIRTWRRG